MSRQLHELFMASCGVFGPWGVNLLRPDPGSEERLFTAPYIIVGNREDLNLHVPDPQLSRRHAYLQVLPRGVFCVDLSNRGGIRWDGENREAGWLQPGQPVRFGSYGLDLLPSGACGWRGSGGDPLSERTGEATLPPIVVEVSIGDKIIAQGRMNRVLALVGRSTRCLFHINHGSLSKFHCSLIRTPTGLWVVDLLSRNGTYQNGRRVRCARLHEDDELQVGKYLLRCRLPSRNGRVIVELRNQQPEPVVAAPPQVLVAVPEPPVPPLSQETALEPKPAGRSDSTTLAARTGRTLLAEPGPHVGPEWSMLMAMVSQFNHMQQQMFDQFQENIALTTRTFATLHQDQMTQLRQELEQLRAISSELRSLTGGSTPPRSPSPPPRHPSAAAVPGENGHRAPDVEDTCPPSPCAQNAEGLHLWLNERISALQEERQSRWHKILGMILGN